MAPKPMFVTGGLRAVLLLVVALQWMCGIVNLGLTGYLIHRWGAGLHFMFGLVIGCINAWFYWMYMWWSVIRIYKGYAYFINIAFSHLWLTYFIFNALDYNADGGCAAAKTQDGIECGKKYALEAMSFATFFFTLVATPLDILLYIQLHYSRQRHQRSATAPPPLENGGLTAADGKHEPESSGANVV